MIGRIIKAIIASQIPDTARKITPKTIEIRYGRTNASSRFNWGEITDAKLFAPPEKIRTEIQRAEILCLNGNS